MADYVTSFLVELEDLEHRLVRTARARELEAGEMGSTGDHRFVQGSISGLMEAVRGLNSVNARPSREADDLRKAHAYARQAPHPNGCRSRAERFERLRASMFTALDIAKEAIDQGEPGEPWATFGIEATEALLRLAGALLTEHESPSPAHVPPEPLARPDGERTRETRTGGGHIMAKPRVPLSIAMYPVEGGFDPAVIVVVVCDDGTVWSHHTGYDEPFEELTQPIPGTRADLADDDEELP